VAWPIGPDNSENAFRSAALRRLTRLAPADPRAWAAVLYRYQGRLWSAARAVERPREGLPLEQGDRRMTEEAVRRGRVLDPHNAFWDLAEMTIATAARDGPRAEQALLRAAEGWRYSDYEDERRAAVYRSCQRLGLSRLRAKLTSHEYETPWVLGARVPIYFVARRAAEKERVGAREALQLYEAVLRLDRLVREVPDNSWVARNNVWPLSAAAWEARYERRQEPPTDWRDEGAKRTWKARALESFLSFAASNGRADLAVVAQHASDAWQRVRIEAAGREHRDERLGMLGLCCLGSLVWWLQLLVLAVMVVSAVLALALRRIRAALAHDPSGVGWRWALGIAMGAGVVLVCLCLGGVHMPAYGLMSGPRPTAFSCAAPWVAVGLLGLVVLGLPMARGRGMPSTEALARGATLTAEWLAVLCAGGYAAMTLCQTVFQAWAAGAIP